MNRLEELRNNEESSGNVPSLLFIEEGEYGAGEGRCIEVNIPLSVYGAGRGRTTLVGVGLSIQGNKSDGIVEIEELTIQGGKGHGLDAYNGMNVITRGCTVEEFQGTGVYAYGADISCDDLQVIGCGESGVFAFFNATITLRGQGTNIQGNGTKGRSYDYGLNTFSFSSSSIRLVRPLTKEKNSTSNGSGRNWGGPGTIEQVEH